jgi:hypothetical protein
MERPGRVQPELFHRASDDVEVQGMKITEFFLGELEREGASTRKVLERVPEGKNAWKPHERSMNLGYLAALVAQMPAWVELMINSDEFDLMHPTQASSVQRNSRRRRICWRNSTRTLQKR